MDFDKGLKIAYITCVAIATLASATVAVCTIRDRKKSPSAAAAPEVAKA